MELGTSKNRTAIGCVRAFSILPSILSPLGDSKSRGSGTVEKEVEAEKEEVKKEVEVGGVVEVVSVDGSDKE